MGSAATLRARSLAPLRRIRRNAGGAVGAARILRGRLFRSNLVGGLCNQTPGHGPTHGRVMERLCAQSISESLRQARKRSSPAQANYRESMLQLESYEQFDELDSLQELASPHRKRSNSCSWLAVAGYGWPWSVMAGRANRPQKAKLIWTRRHLSVTSRSF